MQQLQTVIRLRTDEPAMSSSEWRGILSNSPALAGAPWDSIAVFQSGTALSVIARTPAASEWLNEAYGTVLGVALDALGRVAVVEKLDRAIGSTDKTPYLWCYDVPKLVVCTKARDWAPYRAEQLDESVRQALTVRMNEALARQSREWGIASGSPVVSILDEGRPMPLKGAIRGSTNHAGQPITVMSRLGVKLVSASRMEGEWFLGLLGGLGFGRTFRTGYLAKDSIGERELSELGLAATV